MKFKAFISGLFCIVAWTVLQPQLWGQSNYLVTTFTNPLPAASDYFGASVAGLGADRVLIGAYFKDAGSNNTGAAYLYGTNGVLLTTFANPTPEENDFFGNALAAVGNDRVLIGAFVDDTGQYDSGAAYLFSTNGTLLTTFTNPVPTYEGNFGYSLAAVGSDRVLIGAIWNDAGAPKAGSAYLFRTDGALLMTFTNPTPDFSDGFGCAVAIVGNDRLLIGALNDSTGAINAGAAYLFSTNGTLLTTFTNPTPAASDYFGSSVAALGSDRILIGAPNDNTGATDAGAVYLFNASGMLLTTFTNPTPEINDYFGYSVAAIGTDRVLIGAYGDNSSGEQSGVVYQFSTNGTLLGTLTKSTPEANDWFGFSIATLGSNWALIGAFSDNTGATDAGAAYLFNVGNNNPPPTFGSDSADFNDVPFIHAAAGTVRMYVGQAAYAGQSYTRTYSATNFLGVNALRFDETGIPAYDKEPLTVVAAKDTSGQLWLFQVIFNGINIFTVPTLAEAVCFSQTSFIETRIASGNYALGIVVTNGTSTEEIINLYATLPQFPGTTFVNTRWINGSDTDYKYYSAANGKVLDVWDDSGNVNGNGWRWSGLSSPVPALLSITNPTPAASDYFGYSVAAMGTGRLLIGAYHDDTGAADAGAAYLFSTNGTLLITLTNPSPAASDYFGYSVAAVGNDRALIGAYRDNTGASDAGVAYLFSTNGSLLTTFTNPSPAAGDWFGYSVSAVGDDRVLIGAPYDDTAATDAGAAYLFGTNGELLAMFVKPTPGRGDSVGYSVAAVGTGMVLVGAPFDDTGASDTGAAYLFDTNGTWLTTFTNPAPAVSDWFGWSVSALATDRVLIGAYADDTSASNDGAAYLFSTNGSLLTSFTNPTPSADKRFGVSVSAVGTDRVLIGALFDDTVASDAGAAYLLSTNGTLLATLTKPTPEASGWFGISSAAVGSDRVLIGAYGDNTGALDTGAAYLYYVGSTGNTEPEITSQLRSQSAVSGANVIFSVNATGSAPLSYVWYFNGNLINSASGPVYILPSAAYSQAGEYSVIVSNPYGSVTNTATLSLLDLHMYAGLTIAGPVGANYRVEFATILNTNNWQVLTNIVLPTNPYRFIDWDSGGTAKRFYRAVPVP